MISGRVVRRLLVSIGFLLAQCQVGAQVPNMTQGELALTPDFCQDVQTMNGWSQHSNPSPRSPHWVGLMGKTFWGMHHYCWALIHLQRANRAGETPQFRKWAIQEAIDDFGFVVKIAPADFVLLPEIHFRIGDAYLLLGDVGSAFGEFAKSRELKPDYWPPYVAEANRMMKAGMNKEALALLERGLALMPNEPNLVAAVRKVNGARTKGPPPASK